MLLDSFLLQVASVPRISLRQNKDECSVEATVAGVIISVSNFSSFKNVAIIYRPALAIFMIG
jgi:hypothetical protein